MAPPVPPSNVLPYLQQAASSTGLPLSVVEAQNYAESGYGSDNGPSSAGAEGPWQFLPSTYTGAGGKAGTENDWAASTPIYIKYMDSLLTEEGGNIFKALEAYNAGPGNLGAGAGYASGIESSAGVSQSAKAGNAVNTAISIPLPIPGFPSISSGSLGTIGSSIAGLFGLPNLKDAAQRLALILLGVALIIVGIAILTKGGGGKAAPVTVNNEESSRPASAPSTFARSEAAPKTKVISKAPQAAKSVGTKEAIGALTLA